MKTPASIAGHPIHPMLVPVAIGGFLLSFAFDVLCWFSGQPVPNAFTQTAYYTMIGGIVGALAAAIFGFVDLLSLPRGPIRGTALKHMSINLVVVFLYVVNATMRTANPANLTVPMVLSLVAVLLLVVSGWLGGKLVYEGGVGVDNGKTL
jgi:uncharacterized membrane protein